MQFPWLTYESREYANKTILQGKRNIKMNSDIALFLLSNEGIRQPINTKDTYPINQQ